MQDMDGLVWMVDSADTERLNESKNELTSILKCHGLYDCPILIYANKQDLPNKKSPYEISELLDTKSLGQRETYVQGSCCTTGEGVFEGFEYLAQMIRRYRKAKAEKGW